MLFCRSVDAVRVTSRVQTASHAVPRDSITCVNARAKGRVGMSANSSAGRRSSDSTTFLSASMISRP